MEALGSGSPHSRPTTRWSPLRGACPELVEGLRGSSTDPGQPGGSHLCDTSLRLAGRLTHRVLRKSRGRWAPAAAERHLIVERMTKLHLDTDIGGDIDDLCALAMVLNWPDVQLLAVTTVADDQGRRAGYARYALKLAGRSDVPVAAGADVSLGCYRVKMEFPREADYWPEPVLPANTPLDLALALLERSVEQGATIAAVGPFTNLALLERRSPGTLRNANLCLMGGYVFPPRHGFPQWENDMDWNVQVDVESACLVIQSSNPILVPIAVTVETSLRRAYLQTLARSGSLSSLIARQADSFARDENIEARYAEKSTVLPHDTINFQHDPLACAIALGWNDGVEMTELPIRSEIREGWLHIIQDDKAKPTRIVTRVDAHRFNEFWLKTVAPVNAISQYAGA